jgi:Mg-chelatase subunit ChlD
MATPDQDERLRRWRLILGGGPADGTRRQLTGDDKIIDSALSALYDSDYHGHLGGEYGPRSGGREASSPNIARWLGDIRQYFPSPVVQVMQQDALERLDLSQMLLEPELLSQVTPDVHLVTDLLALNQVMPDETRETARQVVRQVVDELERKLRNPMHQAVRGSLNRALRNQRPRQLKEIDWGRTILKNLKHYQPEYKTIIPERLLGFGRRQSSLRDVILCIDQSGSMATSVVYAGVYASVLASLRALRTQVVVFDTAVVDLSDLLHDPVELLFATRLGGGTDINQALAYSQKLVQRPKETIFILLSDLYEGGNHNEMLNRITILVRSGVQFITLLALNDDGAPAYDATTAGQLATLNIPVFACTPDLFPDMMAATINRQDLHRWAASNDIVTARSMT